MNWKFFIPTALLVLVTIYAFTFRAPRSTSPGDNPTHLLADPDIQKLAMKYGDHHVATLAMYQKLAANSEAPALLDSLAAWYYATGMYPQAYAVAKDVCENHRPNLSSMNIWAHTARLLGNAEEAISLNQQLAAHTGEAIYHYQVAAMQFELQRLEECQQTVNTLLADTTIGRQKIGIAYGDNETQEVSLKAATLNLDGAIKQASNQNEEAKRSFEQALQIEPGFELAQNNHRGLQ